MSEKIKAKYTTYLAGAIEHASVKESLTWREIVRQELDTPDLLIYDPILQESSKVGRESSEQVAYITGLKRGGHRSKFLEEMWRIWFGNVSQNSDYMEVLRILRARKHIDGNFEDEIKYWGDFEAVVRSDFIVVWLPKDVKTVGTIFEVLVAMLFKIPIYLIIDASKTETNSSLLFAVLQSGGETFYKLSECVKYIKDKYKLKIND